MNNGGDYIVLTNIFEKKECIVDGKKQIYYEKLNKMHLIERQ